MSGATVDLVPLGNADLLGELAMWSREYHRAFVASAAAADRRAKLPAGASRARVTTANANWASQAEHRDLCQRRLADVVAECQRRALLSGGAR